MFCKLLHFTVFKTKEAMTNPTFEYKSKKVNLFIEIIPCANLETIVLQSKIPVSDKRKIAKGLISYYDLIVVSRLAKLPEKPETEGSMKHYYPQVILSTNQAEQEFELVDIAKNHLIPGILKYWDLALR